MSARSHDSPRIHLRALERFTRIHEAIGSRRFPDCRALAELLERDVRTVKRDIAEMRRTHGAPIRYSRARGGFYYEEPGWQPPAVRISEGDLLAFFTAEHALGRLGHTPEAALLRASLARLAAYLPEHVSVDLAALGARFSYEPPPRAEVSAETLKALARVVAERRTIEFDYYSPHTGERTRRRADVLLLHNFAGDWYAISYDHDRSDTRDFHLARMGGLRITDDTFEPPAGWNKNDYLRRGFSMMRGGEMTTVALRFDSYQARWMRERHTFHPEESREELPDGGMRLSFPVGANGLEAVARFVCTYAGHCRAEAPADLRHIVRERLALALDQHPPP